MTIGPLVHLIRLLACTITMALSDPQVLLRGPVYGVCGAGLIRNGEAEIDGWLWLRGDPKLEEGLGILPVR